VLSVSGTIEKVYAKTCVVIVFINIYEEVPLSREEQNGKMHEGAS